jgi:hypothetical protein
MDPILLVGQASHGVWMENRERWDMMQVDKKRPGRKKAWNQSQRVQFVYVLLFDLFHHFKMHLTNFCIHTHNEYLFEMQATNKMIKN